MMQTVERVTIGIELDPYMGLKALSAYCGLSVRTLRAHISDPLNPLPCFRLGGKILVLRSDFDRWMRQHRVGSGQLDRVVDSVIGPSKVRRG